MAAVATTLRSLLLTATGSIAVLGTVLAIRATTPAGQADVFPAPVSSPTGGSADSSARTFAGPSGAAESPESRGAPTSPVIPVPLEDSAPLGLLPPWGIPIPPGAPARVASPPSWPSLAPPLSPLAPVPLPPPFPLHSPREGEAGAPRWEHYLGRTPRSSSTATRMNPPTMITQIHLARAWKPSSLISGRGT
ncbi:hypothetical protein [Streptosporangium sp. NPDC049078]|uniref:hypothetical protein n=1 Tax=Streptosporangium sp. NPDC049078 TaxID=3155767 RepID=UPI00343BDBD3